MRKWCVWMFFLVAVFGCVQVHAATVKDVIITSSIDFLRDPAVLVDNGVYYVYGTDWKYSKNTTGDLQNGWSELKSAVIAPEDVQTNMWAPEVHKYNGAYYMFTTYFSKQYQRRGCTIFKASSPEGPFTEWSGFITPTDWDSIDGTLYIDESGQPWMVFVHEWISTSDNVGRMVAAKLSPDFKSLISTPIELFRADDSAWSRERITDGPWLYKTKDGSLLMIWSNWDPYGYCVGIARSSNGKIDGTWTQDEKPLFSREYTGEHDGGHGMIFRGLDKRLYLSLHSPNYATETRGCTPVFVPLKDTGHTLVINTDDSFSHAETGCFNNGTEIAGFSIQGYMVSSQIEFDHAFCHIKCVETGEIFSYDVTAFDAEPADKEELFAAIPHAKSACRLTMNWPVDAADKARLVPGCHYTMWIDAWNKEQTAGQRLTLWDANGAPTVDEMTFLYRHREASFLDSCNFKDGDTVDFLFLQGWLCVSGYDLDHGYLVAQDTQTQEVRKHPIAQFDNAPEDQEAIKNTVHNPQSCARVSLNTESHQEFALMQAGKTYRLWVEIWDKTETKSHRVLLKDAQGRPYASEITVTYAPNQTEFFLTQTSATLMGDDVLLPFYYNGTEAVLCQSQNPFVCTATVDGAFVRLTPGKFVGRTTVTISAEGQTKQFTVTNISYQHVADATITTSVSGLRDPFILEENGCYYVYGSGWKYGKNTTGNVDSGWTALTDVVEVPTDAQKDYWAPEVHAYEGAYYMTTSYFSETIGRRVCRIFRADTPKGPFLPHSGILTPSDWNSIDASLFIDDDGQPWLVFAHEWVSTDDGAGHIAVMKLSSDLRTATDAPKELFSAKDAPWTTGLVGGCPYIYRTQKGSLLLLWTGEDGEGMAIGIARNTDGKVDGNWVHEPYPLYAKRYHGIYDGSQASVWKASNGHAYLVLHSPNVTTNGQETHLVLIPLMESGDMLFLNDVPKEDIRISDFVPSVRENIYQVYARLQQLSAPCTPKLYVACYDEDGRCTQVLGTSPGRVTPGISEILIQQEIEITEKGSCKAFLWEAPQEDKALLPLNTLLSNTR